MPYFDGFGKRAARNIARGRGGFSEELTRYRSMSSPGWRSLSAPGVTALQAPPPPFIGEEVELKHIGGAPVQNSFSPGEWHPSARAWGIFLRYARNSSLFVSEPGRPSRIRDVKSIPMTRYLLNSAMGSMFHSNLPIMESGGYSAPGRLTVRQREILRDLGREYGNTCFFRRVEPRFTRASERVPWREVAPPDLYLAEEEEYMPSPEDMEKVRDSLDEYLSDRRKKDYDAIKMATWGLVPSYPVGRKVSHPRLGAVGDDARRRLWSEYPESIFGVFCERVIPGRCSRRIRYLTVGRIIVNLDWKGYIETTGLRALDDGHAEEFYRDAMRLGTMNIDAFAKTSDMTGLECMSDISHRWWLLSPEGIAVDDRLGAAGGRGGHRAAIHPALAGSEEKEVLPV